MSYEPLHHKYRPKSFAELVGQEAIATTLTNAIRSDKIAPAYLFTGPRGTGKTSSARILAKSLNCLQSSKPTAEPCGKCDVCRGITKGSTLDVIEIDAASNTGVDNIRELIEKAQFAPVQCRYKVYVIDECHMLSTQAFNALLKTLEEPPKHVVFVLATTDPQRVLPTIISRCQRFDFRRIHIQPMVKHLSAIASQENISISPDAITLIAQISQGGLRDAQSLLDQAALMSGEVTPDQIWDLVGTVSEQDLLGLLEAIAQNVPDAVLEYTRNILERGREPLTILQNLAAFYRDLLIAKTASNRQDLVTCTQQTWTQLVAFAHRLDINAILVGQQHLRTAEVQIKNSTQPRLWLEVTLLGLLPGATNTQSVAPQNHQAPATNHQAPQNHQAPATNHQAPAINHNWVAPTEKPTTNQVNSDPPTPPIPQEIAPGPPDDLTQVWQQVLANLQPKSRQEMLRQMSSLMEFDGRMARIAIKQAWYDKGKSDIPIITEAFLRTFQREIQIVVEKSVPQDSTRVPHPPNISYTTQAPTPVPAKPESVTEAVITPTPPPPLPTPPVTNYQAEEVAIAAQRLAKFFEGQVIRLSDDGVDFSEAVAVPESVYESDFDEE
jgi:DNA polymerase-3 subunit gamma/tau